MKNLDKMLYFKISKKMLFKEPLKEMKFKVMYEQKLNKQKNKIYSLTLKSIIKLDNINFHKRTNTTNLNNLSGQNMSNNMNKINKNRNNNDINNFGIIN